ncbi:MAG: L-lactate dehydrogenase [Candidatus Omnitrophica bacterium]|nr:L-lactate dehydrogenase [Candidatus Omnitrophota bacterium]
MNNKPKIAIIGAGNVGSTFAYALMIRGIAREIVIIDKDRERARGHCMDLNHGMSFTRPTEVVDSGYEGCEGADIVVITAGAKQQPGQTRTDLVRTNTEIFKKIVPEVLEHAGGAILLVVTNPVDILTYITMKLSGLPRNRVLGSGTVLDTSRFRYLISEHCDVDPRNVHAYIIGEHGDTELPVWSGASIGGIRIDRYCPTCRNFRNCDREKALQGIFDNVKNSAYKVIESKGATYYAIGLSLVRIVETILGDEKSVLPVSTLIEDYYGVEDVCLSLPCKLGSRGIEQFLKLELSPEEQGLFKKSAQSLKKILEELEL